MKIFSGIFLSLCQQRKTCYHDSAKRLQKISGYGYISGLDEYARYINEMSNMSDTFMYMESQTNDTGFLDKNNLEILSDFLNDIGVKNIMLGGGYLGKCLDDFYESIRKNTAMIMYFLYLK